MSLFIQLLGFIFSSTAHRPNTIGRNYITFERIISALTCRQHTFLIATSAITPELSNALNRRADFAWMYDKLHSGECLLGVHLCLPL